MFYFPSHLISKNDLLWVSNHELRLIITSVLPFSGRLLSGREINYYKVHPTTICTALLTTSKKQLHRSSVVCLEVKNLYVYWKKYLNISLSRYIYFAHLGSLWFFQSWVLLFQHCSIKGWTLQPLLLRINNMRQTSHGAGETGQVRRMSRWNV